MTFERNNSANLFNISRSGCGHCGGCSGNLGANTNQANFGAMQTTQRQNKGC